MSDDQNDKKQVYHHQGQGNPIGHGSHDSEVLTESRASDYWRANLSFLGKLLLVWFAVSFGAGVILADTLDQYTFLGFPLGFWFAQQGAIYVFVVLIFVYVAGMQKIDREYSVDDDDEERGAPSPTGESGEGDAT